MDELVKKLQETVGLSTEQAVEAAKCVKSYLKDKVPAMVAEKLDNIFDGEKIEVGDILREKAEGLAGDAKETLGNVADMMDGFAAKATRSTESVVNKFSSFIKDTFNGNNKES